jgi:hypothetical protein
MIAFFFAAICDIYFQYSELLSRAYFPTIFMAPVFGKYP